jgi:hypothetical protein
MDLIYSAERDEVRSKRAALEASHSPKRRRKTEPVDEWREQRYRMELESLDSKLEQLRMKVEATNIWDENFTVTSLAELWDHVRRPDLKGLKVSATRYSGELTSLSLSIELESVADYENRVRASGPVEEIRPIRAIIEEQIQRRNVLWRRAANHWIAQVASLLLLVTLLTVEAVVILHAFGVKGDVTLASLYLVSLFVGALVISPLKIVQTLTPAVIVKGWGRLESRREWFAYIASGVLVTILGTLIWTVVMTSH